MYFIRLVIGYLMNLFLFCFIILQYKNNKRNGSNVEVYKSLWITKMLC
jgi:hypothetical protein